MGDEFSGVINALPALIWTALPAGNVDFLNRPWRDHTGVRPDEASRGGWKSAVRPENLSDVLEMTSVIAWSTGADGYCDFCNQRRLGYTGLSLEQVQGWGWGVAIRTDGADGLVEHWQSCVASGMPVNTEASMLRFDGVYRRGPGATFASSMPRSKEDGNLYSNQASAVNDVQSGMRDL